MTIHWSRRTARPSRSTGYGGPRCCQRVLRAAGIMASHLWSYTRKQLIKVYNNINAFTNIDVLVIVIIKVQNLDFQC